MRSAIRELLRRPVPCRTLCWLSLWEHCPRLRGRSPRSKCPLSSNIQLGVSLSKSPYFVSLCGVCFLHQRQYLLNSSRSG